MLHVVRWISLPLAAFCVLAPLYSTLTVYQHYKGKVLTAAAVLAATLRNAGARGIGSEYDLYVRYPVAGRTVYNNVRISSTFSKPRAGGTIELFVDPETKDAEDDVRAGSWMMVGWGALAAVIFVLVGFRSSGKLLRASRS